MGWVVVAEVSARMLGVGCNVTGNAAIRGSVDFVWAGASLEGIRPGDCRRDHHSWSLLLWAVSVHEGDSASVSDVIQGCSSQVVSASTSAGVA